MTQYIVIMTEGTERNQFGIAALAGKEMVDQLADVTVSLADAVQLAACLQKNGVSTLHFRDVIEDYIAAT